MASSETQRQVSHVPASRRGFLAGAAAAGGAVVTGLSGAVSVARAAHSGASERVRIGVIGCGGRGAGAMRDALEASPDTVIVAMADAFQDRIDETYKTIKELFSDRIDVPEDRRFAGFDGYKSVLQSDCDLVILATPPGFRPVHFEAAVEAGKHIFMEKPVAVDAPGVRRVLEAGKRAKEKNLAVGVGLQRRHEQHYIETIDRLQQGAIGDVLLTRVFWNSDGVWVRPRQPGQTEMEYQMRNWYYFNWLCGDHVVEQHIHNLDVSNWLMGMVPKEAVGVGGRQVRTGKDHGQIFDHHCVEFTYPDGRKMISQCRHMPGTWSNVSEHCHGASGTADITDAKIVGAKGEVLWRFKGARPAGYVQEHVDLLKSIKDGAPLNETEYGAMSTMTSIFGRMATYCGRKLSWDEALASEESLAPQRYAFDAEPPVLPDSEGRYPIPVPGGAPATVAAKS